MIAVIVGLSSRVPVRDTLPKAERGIVQTEFTEKIISLIDAYIRCVRALPHNDESLFRESLNRNTCGVFIEDGTYGDTERISRAIASNPELEFDILSIDGRGVEPDYEPFKVRAILGVSMPFLFKIVKSKGDYKILEIYYPLPTL